MTHRIAFFSLSIATAFLLSACAGNTKTTDQDRYDSSTTQTKQTSSTTQSTPPPSSMTKSPNKTDSSPQLEPPVAGEKVATVETDLGTIKFKLFSEQAPEMVKNFEELAKAGKYTNVPFHRVIKDFMIQTGDFEKKDGTGGYSYKGVGTMLDDEIAPSLKHLYGTVSMANRGSDTNGSQFFIVTNKDGTSWLDGGYSIFGQVYEGMDVAEKIAELQVPNDQKGTPSKIVNVKKVAVTTYGGK